MNRLSKKLLCNDNDEHHHTTVVLLGASVAAAFLGMGTVTCSNPGHTNYIFNSSSSSSISNNSRNKLFV
jgi:hypothetical protein